MDSFLQKKLLSLFHYSLNQKGILILGNSETSNGREDLFTAIDLRMHIYQTSSFQKTKNLFNSPSIFVQTKLITKENIAIVKIPDNIQTLTDNLLLQQFSPVSILVTKQSDILYLTGNTGKYLTPAAGKVNMSVFSMAREKLQEKLPATFRKVAGNYEKHILRNIKTATNSITLCVDVSFK
jgi:two-component system CheB/CheR fusion protein